jgi:hypothetical protein
MGRALFPILDKFLPKSNPTILECIHQLSGFQHDGYKLLDSVMARILPVFCEQLSIQPPNWSEYGNIIEMQRQWNLYFRLTRKKGAFYTPVEKSMLFLGSITEHSLLGLITSLKGSVQSFKDGLVEFEDDSPLPTHLTIAGMVSTMTSTTSPLSTSMTFASTNATKSSAMTPSYDIAIPNIQGAACHATVAGPPTNRRGGRRGNAPRRDKKDIVCATCGFKNHEEIECRQLGRLLVMSGRAEKLPAHIKKKIIENFKKFYGIPHSPVNHRTACQDLENWCMARNVSEEEITDWYDWDAYCAYLEGATCSDAASLEVEASE